MSAANKPGKNFNKTKIQKQASKGDLPTSGKETPKIADNNPNFSEAKSAGAFSGDVRRLPQNPPKVQFRPKRKDPKLSPKEIKKSTNEKPN